MTPGRLPGLDRVRGAALLLMLVHHFTEWLGDDAREILPGWRWFAVSDVAAPAFAVAAGASLHLFVEKRRRGGVDGAPLHADVLRRYGLLVPLGVVLGLVVFRNPFGFGVLEALGVGTLVAYVLDRRLPVGVLAPVAVAFLLADGVVARVVEGWDTASFGYRSLHGTFPVATYVGFVLTGVVGAALLRGRDRPREAALVGLGLAAATCFMAAAGHVPDRYPAGLAFVVPALAGTFLGYAALAAARPIRLVDEAACHTLGVYVTHHVVFLVARWWVPTLDPVAALASAVVLAVAFAAVAPLVPALPWSPRKGRAPRPGTYVAATASAAFLSSSSAADRPSVRSQRSGTTSRQATRPKSSEPM